MTGPKIPGQVNPPGRIMQSGLPLVGEIDVAITSNVQVVAAAEGFGIARGYYRLHPSRLRIELHEAVPIVGHEDTSVGRDFQPVRPAAILDRERPLAAGGDLEDAPEGNVDDIEIAVGVE